LTYYSGNDNINSVTDLQQLSGEMAAAYRAQQRRIDAERATLALGSKSALRFDSGKRPIEESPLFGGEQPGLFE
jgi:hypothetical protein